MRDWKAFWLMILIVILCFVECSSLIIFGVELPGLLELYLTIVMFSCFSMGYVVRHIEALDAADVQKIDK